MLMSETNLNFKSVVVKQILNATISVKVQP